MIRKVKTVVILALVLWSTHRRCEAQTLVDPNAKFDPKLVHVIFDLNKKLKVYAVQPEKDSTVQSVLKRFGPLPRNKDNGYRICLVRSGTNGEADSVMSVDWNGVGPFGNPVTDYPLEPGDRINIARPFVEFRGLARSYAPHERLWGWIADAGTAMCQRFRGIFRSQ